MKSELDPVPLFHLYDLLIETFLNGLKRLGVQPQNEIPGFILHFPLEPSYGYLRFEGNGKIPLGR